MARTIAVAVLIGLVLTGVAVGSVVWWQQQRPEFEDNLVTRGEYKKPKTDVSFLKQKEGGLELPGELIVGEALPADAPRLPGDWPRYRGNDFDAVCKDDTPLADSWPAEGPPVLWSVDCGEGYAGAAVHKGRVYLLDYDQEKEADALRCFDLATGKELWRRWYNVYIRRQHGYSRTVPAIKGGYCVTLGPLCHVLCVDAETGEAKWGVNLIKEYETEVPEWYASQCPLIEEIDGKLCAIIAPGGKALMWARDCETGEVVWETPNPKGWHMTHSSIVPFEIDGTRMLVVPMTGGVIAVDAKTGKLLWQYVRWTISPANVPMPIPHEDKIFFCGGYGRGSLMLQVKKDGDGWAVEPVYKVGPRICGSDQQTPVKVGEHIYMVLPKDAGGAKGQLTCLNVSGEKVWDSGSETQFGLGPFMVADGKLIVMDDYGLLTMAKASPDGYQQLAQHKVLDGHDSWAPLAMANGLLLVRDAKRMICLDLRKDRGGKTGE